jgi:flavoprotein
MQDVKPRLAWGITGSGHFLKESLDIALSLPHCDLFLSRAAEEILPMYGISFNGLKDRARVYRDTTASSVPVGLFYYGHYHTVVIAPATSNTVAKCALGLSDSLISNLFAQAGKTRVPIYLYACDTEPEMDTEAPKDWVKVYPRPIDLEYTRRVGEMDGVTVLHSVEALQIAVEQRLRVAPTPTLGDVHRDLDTLIGEGRGEGGGDGRR